MRVWAGRWRSGVACVLATAGVTLAVTVPACRTDPPSPYPVYPALTSGEAGMAGAEDIGALPKPQVVGAACQAYDFDLSVGCTGCNTPFFCNCPHSTLFDQTPTCTPWGLCVKSFDCTNICNQSDPGKAYQDVAACLQTRACASSAECPGGVCANGACSTGEERAPCAVAADCMGGHCVKGQCASGELNDICVEDTDCTSHFCVSPMDDFFPAVCGSGVEGSVCADDNDCSKGKCVNPYGSKPSDPPPFYRGQCSEGGLFAPCMQDSDCASGGACLTAPGGEPRCYQGGIGQYCRNAKDCVTGACDYSGAADAGTDAGTDAGALLGMCVTGPP